MPMDPATGPYAWHPELPLAELESRLNAALLKVPYAAGINNHMGSRMTAEPVAMALADGGIAATSPVFRRQPHQRENRGRRRGATRGSGQRLARCISGRRAHCRGHYPPVTDRSQAGPQAGFGRGHRSPLPGHAGRAGTRAAQAQGSRCRMDRPAQHDQRTR